ncbi:hypothetical protein C7U93_30015 [Bradyrhizobium sp. WBOS8]|nr:hypothetical protein [Bradyrhizobium sp. WBOS8]
MPRQDAVECFLPSPLVGEGGAKRRMRGMSPLASLVGWAKVRSCAPCPRLPLRGHGASAPLPTLRFRASG